MDNKKNNKNKGENKVVSLTENKKKTVSSPSCYNGKLDPNSYEESWKELSDESVKLLNRLVEMDDDE